ncbi:hypothetical protein BOX15_Mlig018910g2, partial [Macrostomum lignano]
AIVQAAHSNNGALIYPTQMRRDPAHHRPKDHASIQLAFAELNADGRMTGGKKVFNISGDVRRRGESDMSLNVLTSERGITAPFLLKLDETNRTA